MIKNILCKLGFHSRYGAYWRRLGPFKGGVFLEVPYNHCTNCGYEERQITSVYRVIPPSRIIT